METHKDSLKDEALALRSNLTPYCATAVVTGVLYHEVAKYRNKKRRDRDSQVSLPEHLALLLLPEVQSAQGIPPTEAVIAEAADRSYAIMSNLYRNEVRSAINIEDGTNDQTFAQRFRMAGLMLRNPGVPEHWTLLMQTFATDFDPKIERWLPFSLSEALILQQALQADMIAKSTAREHRWREVAEHAWLAYRKKQTPADNSGIDFPSFFSRIRAERKAPRKAIFQFVREYALRDIDALALVDIESVANYSGIAAERVETFLALFTLNPEIKEDWRLLPSSRNALSRTPFIATKRGFFVPYLPLLQWALLPRIEELINPCSHDSIVVGRTGWNAYERQRSRFLEGTVARIFQQVADAAPRRNVTFNVSKGSPQYEMDVCAHFDTTTYVIECKATTLNDATWRGAELSLESDVRTVLEEATIQVNRAVDFLRKEHQRCENYITSEEYIPILVTLDHSGPINAGIRATRTNAKATKTDPPWALSLLDLFTLQDLLESRWRFKHYARRRLVAATERRDTFAFDELDFYHNYRLLNVCAMPPGASHFVFVAPTDEVDDFYNSLDSRIRKKPTPSVPHAIRTLIDDLEVAAAYGWSDVVCDLLDLSSSVADILANSMHRVQSRVVREGTVISRLRQPEQGFGLIYAATDAFRLSEAIISAQLQTPPMSRGVELYLIIVHDARSHRVLHGVFERQGPSWRTTTRSALQLGEEGLFLSVSPHIDRLEL